MMIELPDRGTESTESLIRLGDPVGVDHLLSPPDELLSIANFEVIPYGAPRLLFIDINHFFPLHPPAAFLQWDAINDAAPRSFSTTAAQDHKAKRRCLCG